MDKLLSMNQPTISKTPACTSNNVPRMVLRPPFHPWLFWRAQNSCQNDAGDHSSVSRQQHHTHRWREWFVVDPSQLVFHKTHVCRLWRMQWFDRNGIGWGNKSIRLVRPDEWWHRRRRHNRLGLKISRRHCGHDQSIEPRSMKGENREIESESELILKGKHECTSK